MFPHGETPAMPLLAGTPHRTDWVSAVHHGITTGGVGTPLVSLLGRCPGPPRPPLQTLTTPPEHTGQQHSVPAARELVLGSEPQQQQRALKPSLHQHQRCPALAAHWRSVERFPKGSDA